MKYVDATFIDKTDQSDPTRIEEYCRIKLGTLVSRRLNIEKCIL